MLAEKNRDKQCFFCQRRGHIKSNCRNRQRDVRKAKESGNPFVDGKQTAAITDAITVAEGITTACVP